jgi:hypothetical protein
MPNNFQYLRRDAAKRRAICDGKFGLIRYHSWRTALCSKKCAERFKTRQKGTADGLRRLQPTRNSRSYNHGEISRSSEFRNKEAADCTLYADSCYGAVFDPYWRRESKRNSTRLGCAPPPSVPGAACRRSRRYALASARRDAGRSDLSSHCCRESILTHPAF